MITKFLPYIIIFIILCIIFDVITRKHFQANSPPSIETKLEESKSNKLLMDSIDWRGHIDYKYNKFDFKFKDTVQFTINMQGHRRELIYTGLQIRTTADEWTVIDETLIIN